jgi:hypothetical protein
MNTFLRGERDKHNSLLQDKTLNSLARYPYKRHKRCVLVFITKYFENESKYENEKGLDYKSLHVSTGLSLLV